LFFIIFTYIETCACLNDTNEKFTGAKNFQGSFILFKLSTYEGQGSNIYLLKGTISLIQESMRVNRILCRSIFSLLDLTEAVNEEPTLLGAASEFLRNTNKMCSKDRIRTSKHIVTISKSVKSFRIGNSEEFRLLGYGFV
jgi:hypothetical protein